MTFTTTNIKCTSFSYFSNFAGGLGKLLIVKFVIIVIILLYGATYFVKILVNITLTIGCVSGDDIVILYYNHIVSGWMHSPR